MESNKELAFEAMYNALRLLFENANDRGEIINEDENGEMYEEWKKAEEALKIAGSIQTHNKYMVSYIKYDKKGNPEKDDHYEVFTDSLGVENHKNAEYRFKQLLESENTYTVNLSLIIDSSDYM